MVRQKNSNFSKIESATVRLFLKYNKINGVKSNFLAPILCYKDNPKEDAELLKKYRFDGSLNSVLNIFEQIIPKQERKVNGAVYTPKFIVDYITKKTITSDGLVLDPACGSGAFILGSIKRLGELSKKDYSEIIMNNVYGIDISKDAIRRTKIICILFLLQNGENPKNIKFNFFSADTLIEKPQDIFGKKILFDFVVGNPPYVKIQDLDKKYKNMITARWETVGKGNFNLYFPFFEFAVAVLKDSGDFGYIIPNNYFTSLAGKEFRAYLNKNKVITAILNFNHLKLFKNAQTYTCITLGKKGANKNFIKYAHIADKETLDKLSKVKFNKYKYEWLDDKKWRLMVEEDYDNIKKVENTGIPLGELYKIRVGIATLKDLVFFVPDNGKPLLKKTVKNKVYHIEKGITKKIVKIADMNNEMDLKKNKQRIIFPYEMKGDSLILIKEDYLKSTFPNCYKYLIAVKKELQKRDKGKKSYPEWYAWGRTQAMNYSGTRIYTKTFSNKPLFMIDNEKNNLFCNGYAIFCDKDVNVIKKILNSTIMDYYVRKTSVQIAGDYQCYQKNFIERFGIPILSKNEKDYILSENNSGKLNKFLKKIYKLSL